MSFMKYNYVKHANATHRQDIMRATWQVNHHTPTWPGETYMDRVTIDLDKEPLPIRRKEHRRKIYVYILLISYIVPLYKLVQ